MQTKRSITTGNHQTGSVLVVSLIMLLLLTLIGVAGMKDTLLQEKMVGNVRDREIALQAAESALRAAETFLNGFTAPAMTNNNGLYDETTSTATIRTKPEASFWRDWGWTAADSVAYTKTLDGVFVGSPPRYVIEKMNQDLSSREGYPGGGSCPAGLVCAADLTDVGDDSTILSDYRITVRAVGSTADAVVILQATFRRDKG